MRTESIIHEGLASRYGGASNGAVIDALSRALSNTLEGGKELDGIPDSTLSRAVKEACTSLDYAQAIAMIRGYLRKYRDFKAAEAARSVAAAQEDTVNWGFFLLCWDAFRAQGDVCAVRPLTVSFLAKWLLKKKELIQDDEIDWCARRAVADAEALEGDEKERTMKASYEEAAVLLVMHKVGRSMQKDPDRTAAFIGEKRRQYTEYAVRQFGREPDWTVSGLRRKSATSAFTRKQNG